MRKVFLDPALGFLPVRGEAEFHTSPKYWRIETFSVNAFELVDDVMMPTKILETSRASTKSKSLDDGQVAMYETVVSEIKSGDVTEEDLAVVFPEGAEVFDATSGMYYIQGPDGKHLHEQAVVGGAPLQQDAAAEDRWMWRMGSGFILLNILFCVVLAFVVVRRRIYKS